MIRRGTAHDAPADDDDVVCIFAHFLTASIYCLHSGESKKCSGVGFQVQKDFS
jgi:hypothetical protein